MLILTRKTGESIHIGDDIEITVTRIEPHAVRVAISAPREVPIYRSELLQRREAESAESNIRSPQPNSSLFPQAD